MQNDQRLKGLLHESERVLEYSQRKPHVFVGWLCLMVGTAMGINSVMNIQAMAGMVLVVPAAMIPVYVGVWILFFSRREKVYVTNERVIYLRVNWFGGAGQTASISLRDISRVKLYKSSISYKPRAYSGAIILEMREKGERMLPILQNGEYVLEAIGGELPGLLMNEKGGKAGSNGHAAPMKNDKGQQQ